MIKNIFTVGLLILSCLISCVNSTNFGYNVKHYGALKNIMHQGDLSSTWLDMSNDKKYELQQFVFPRERLTIRKITEFELLKRIYYLS